MQGLPVILKRHNLQSLDKALALFIEFQFCESDFYFLNGSKNCMVATYNFGSVYIVYLDSCIVTLVYKNIRICHECEGRIDKSVPMPPGECSGSVVECLTRD